MSSASDFEKQSQEHVESMDPLDPLAVTALTTEHHEYLMTRHGSVQLDPLPSSDPQDPLNWPNWKKNFEILLIAFQTFSSTFMAAGLTPGFEPMAEAYGVTVPTASYFTSAQIAVMGGMPLFWVPLMNIYGRRPFLIFSTLACAALNIGGGFCTTYGQQMATRVLVAAFISTASAAGASVVADLAFSHERGKKNGWWSLALVVGTPAGPFFTGFIQQHAGTKWIYFTFAIMNFIQFALWLLAEETVYVRNRRNSVSASPIAKFLGFHKKSDKTFAFGLFFRPLKQALNFNVSMAVVAASVTFCYANIVLVVEMPQVFGLLFHLNAQQLSLQYIALIIGSIIGEILAGPLSDWWMARCIKKRGGKKVVVDRLWVSYNGFVLVIVGLIVWGIFLDKAKPGDWKISPLIGAAIAAAGNNIVATVLIAFAIDCDPGYASDVGLYMNLVRQVFGFLGPFYFPYMFENLKFGPSAGLMCALVAVFGAGFMGISHLIGLRRNK
ncbi:major facilitator superfamily multidrug-resistance protein [Scheffersomyces xylosifermentans]|uniref:major facilitator superfamily multidrug-resistance protein n=1 Tax=Scheffersomyces xylosifermentans TaxID=1304137 RepID=UPI00315D51E3